MTERFRLLLIIIKGGVDERQLDFKGEFGDFLFEKGVLILL